MPVDLSNDDSGQNGREAHSPVSNRQDIIYHSSPRPESPEIHLRNSPERNRGGLPFANEADAIDIRSLELPGPLHASPSPNLAAMFSQVEKPLSYAPPDELQPIPMAT